MTSGVFVDTGAWKAVYDRDDPFHKIAKETLYTFKRKRERIITSNFVMDETITLLRMRVNHGSAVEFGDALRASKIINIIPVDSALENQAWDIFKKYRDKTFSFTDCTSFAIMTEQAIAHAFTFDDHFGQFGIICIPGPQDVRKILANLTRSKK